MEDWKKKYEDAIIGIKEVYETADAATRAALETKFPKLAESEDERIRKAIWLVLVATEDDQKDFYATHGLTRKECTDWLERKNYIPENGQIINISELPVWKKKDDSFGHYCDGCGNLVSNGYEIKISDLERTLPKESPSLEKQKEQKEPSAEEYANVLADEEVQGLSVSGEHIPTIKGLIRRAFRFGIRWQKEQKPAEIPVMNGDADLYFDEWNLQQRNPTKRQCFEEGMRYAQRLQKPAEWSEEDEIKLASLINYFEGDALDCSTEDMVRWLKSLRPQPQKLEDWTSEDDELLANVLGCITLIQTCKATGGLKEFKMGHTGEELRSFVRSLKSRPRKQPHWKPSEDEIRH